MIQQAVAMGQNSCFVQNIPPSQLAFKLLTVNT